MKRERGPDQIERDASSVVTVGTFDGVHAGHRSILHYLMERAREHEGRSTVITFDPHPREVLQDRPYPLLTTVEERGDLFEEIGLDRLVVLPFTSEFARREAPDYVRDVLVGQVGMKEIVIGYDHRFGKDREGDPDLLKALSREHDYDVDVMPPQVVDQRIVSSRRIRELLTEGGDVRTAHQLLARPYRLRGEVEEGEGRGGKIGFPTANIAPPERKVVPREGVYAVRAQREGDGDEAPRREGMMNIGTRPTFEDDGAKHLEVHLFNFEGDLYGEQLRIEFVDRIRDEREFDGPEALKRQLSEDRSRCKKALDELF
jgi:riboflavin kinase/FMN adenylyltransferase